MNTMTYSRTAPSLSVNDAGLRQLKVRGRRFAPLAAIVVGHAFLFYAINSGMMSKIAVAVMPKVVTVTFVASPEPLKPAPPPPKTVPVVKLTPTYIPPMPQLATPQVEPTITVAPPSPRTNQPSTPAVAGPVAPPTPAPAAPPSHGRERYRDAARADRGKRPSGASDDSKIVGLREVG
jgi:protein TonB